MGNYSRGFKSATKEEGEIMAKGGSFENEVCKELSKWWTEGERDDVFRRTAGSGGKATSRRKRGRDTAFEFGDISFSDDIGKPFIDLFNIECKTGYSTKSKWDVLDFIDSRQNYPILRKFWEQSSSDSEESNRIPLLIFRRNGRSKCIAFNYKMMDRFSDYIEFMDFQSVIVDMKKFPEVSRLFIVPFNEFLEIVSPEIVKEIYEKHQN